LGVHRGFQAALLVVSAKLPEPLGRHVEHVGEATEMALRILGELDEDRVALELLAVLERSMSVPPVVEARCTNTPEEIPGSSGG
jgi:hypothetical protein